MLRTHNLYRVHDPFLQCHALIIPASISILFDANFRDSGVINNVQKTLLEVWYENDEQSPKLSHRVKKIQAKKMNSKHNVSKQNFITKTRKLVVSFKQLQLLNLLLLFLNPQRNLCIGRFVNFQYDFLECYSNGSNLCGKTS